MTTATPVQSITTSTITTITTTTTTTTDPTTGTTTQTTVTHTSAPRTLVPAYLIPSVKIHQTAVKEMDKTTPPGNPGFYVEMIPGDVNHWIISKSLNKKFTLCLLQDSPTIIHYIVSLIPFHEMKDIRFAIIGKTNLKTEALKKAVFQRRTFVPAKTEVKKPIVIKIE